MSTSKTCTKCGEFKSLDLFYKHNGCHDGVQSHCKACIKASAIAFQKANPSKKKIYEQANFEKIAAKQKAHRQANRKVIAAKQKAYYEANRKLIAAKPSNGGTGSQRASNE